MRFISIVFFIAFISVFPVFAHTIYLNDGTSEESDKVWEQGEYIHFILKGTRNVEIRYSREFVSHVELDSDDNKLKKSTQDIESVGGAGTHTKGKKREAVAADDPGGKKGIQKTAEQAPEYSDDSVIAVPGKFSELIKKHAKIQFYDPRRSEKYWATMQSRHTSYADALKALGMIYQQSEEWVEIRMGEDNNLGNIHRRLSEDAVRLQSRTRSLSEKAGTDSAKAIKPDKDNSASISDHSDSRQPAGPSSAIGGSANESSVENSGGGHKVTVKITKGITFYDPRRPEKYWSDENTRHNSLRDAILSLAERYDKSPDWVEENMGDTNDLAEIHRNLNQNR